MGCIVSKPAPIVVQCPVCEQQYPSTVYSNIGSELYYHITTVHQTAAECVTCTLCDENIAAAVYLDHLTSEHAYINQEEVPVAAPVVSSQHVEYTHNANSGIDTPQDGSNRNMPKPGDKVLCKWGDWQYFDSTILSFDEHKLEYYIEWDDQDPTGRTIPYKHLAINKSPDEDEIGVGTVVLFHQGRYSANAEAGRLSGVRWHQGKVTRSTTDQSGVRWYSGVHTKSAGDGKWVTYKDYNEEFHNYQLDELRCAPNVFDIIQNNSQVQEGNMNTACDVYLSYCPSDSYLEVKTKLAEPHTDGDTYQTMTDPLRIKKDLEGRGFRVMSNIRNHHNGELDLQKIVSCIKNCELFISCISDEYAENENCRMEMQYAKKTAKKPLVPIIVGSAGWDWQASVVGMLIAGERYIDFKKLENYEEKFDDLKTQVENVVRSGAEAPTNTTIEVQEVDKSKDIFISYCWTNSFLSKENNEVPILSGNEFNDPRRIKAILSEKYKVWLDVEQLTSGQVTGMFEQITTGLLNSKCVCAFVSTEYANSDNCKMEFQFATKSLKKPFIPICVGSDMSWEASVIGALVAGGGHEVINLQDCKSEAALLSKIDAITKRITSLCDIEAIETGIEADVDGPPSYDTVIRSRAPQVGDHVISHHFKHAYFTATILSFNKEEMTYHIEWDDGDPSGRTQQYNMVALNIEPDEDDLGVGQRVFFPQGQYGGTDGNNIGGRRYHEGVIDNVQETNGIKHYGGHHAMGEDDGKWVTYKDYNYNFYNMTTQDLRVAPNAMDALFAS